MATSTRVEQPATFSLRLSVLLFPPATPLLTVEFRAIDAVTVQLETNFVGTHGINIKYFVNQPMSGTYLFAGNAIVASRQLRADGSVALLPYVGGGYAHRFGSAHQWNLDTRVGFGSTINADENLWLPVVKTGLGYVF